MNPSIALLGVRETKRRNPPALAGSFATIKVVMA
jgi:hypothetical protein